LKSKAILDKIDSAVPIKTKKAGCVARFALLADLSQASD